MTSTIESPIAQTEMSVASAPKYARKVLFVIWDNYKTERLGIQILSTISTQEGYERDILIINDMTPEEAFNKARAYQPDIIAYSGMTYEHTELQKLNRTLKKTGMEFISIFGGIHYTLNTDDIKNDDAMDVICRGEGEIAWRSFIKAVRDGKDYSGIEKLWVRRDGKIIENPVGLLLENLDDVPFPDRNLIKLDSKDQLLGDSRFFLFGRGCPQKCTYCFNVNYNDLFSQSRVFRLRSVDNMIQEVKQVVAEQKNNFVIINDDIFSYVPKKIMREFCDKYKKEINLPFVCQFRAESVKDEMVIMLKEAGMAVAFVGVETGDEDLARGLLERGKITNDDIIRAFEIFNRHGVRTQSLNMVALPVEDPLSADWKTIDLNIKIKPFSTQWNILIPILGTPLWDYVVENKYIDTESFLNSDRLPSGLTATKIKYKNPYIQRQVNNLHKFAGIVVKFPFLKPLVKILIRFPENKLYQYIFLSWYGYWKTIGVYDARCSFKLILNGLSAIKKFLKNY